MPPVADDHRGAPQGRLQRKFELRMRSASPRAACANAFLLQGADFSLKLLRVLSRDICNQCFRIRWIAVDTLCRGHDEQHPCGYQRADDRRRLVVVDALMHLAVFPSELGQLPFAVLRVGHRIAL